MPWGEISSVPRQNIHGEFGIRAAKVTIFCPLFFIKMQCFEIMKLLICNNYKKKNKHVRT